MCVLGLPRQAEVAQGVPGRLRPRIFLTFWHYKGVRSSTKPTGHLYPKRNPWYSLSEDESISGHMVLSGEPRKESSVTPPGIDPGTVRLVAQRLGHYYPSNTINFFLKQPRGLVFIRPSWGHQSVNAAQKDNSCLFSDTYKTHKCSV